MTTAIRYAIADAMKWLGWRLIRLADRLDDEGRERASSRVTTAAMVSPLATHAASLAAAAGVSMTAICFPPASARTFRLRAWRSA